MMIKLMKKQQPVRHIKHVDENEGKKSSTIVQQNGQLNGRRFSSFSPHHAKCLPIKINTTELDRNTMHKLKRKHTEKRRNCRKPFVHNVNKKRKKL